MNRLTDALYMVRFKVRPVGLLFLAPAASWRERMVETGPWIGPFAFAFWPHP